SGAPEQPRHAGTQTNPHHAPGWFLVLVRACVGTHARMRMASCSAAPPTANTCMRDRLYVLRGATVLGCGILGTELLELQLRGCPIFFRGIAGFTARDHIALRAPPTPCERYDMIHGQFTGRKRSLTVCTDALGNFIAPPLRGTQGFGFGFFAGNMAWIFVNFNPIGQDSSFVL